MIYLLNGTLNEKNTVIEKTSLKRLAQFEKMGIDAKLLLMNFSPRWRKTVGKNQADKRQIQSLFDDLQGFSQTGPKPLSLNDFHDLDGYFRMHDEIREYRFQDGDILVAKALTDKRGRLEQVSYYDRLGTVIQTDYFNDLGDLAMSSYKRDGYNVEQQYFGQSGEQVLTARFDAQHRANYLKADDRANFYRRTDLASAFLTQQLKPGDIVVAERTEYGRLLAQLPATIHKVGTLYNEIPTDLNAYDTLIVRNAKQQLVAEQAGLQVIKGNDYETDGTKIWEQLLQNN